MHALSPTIRATEGRTPGRRPALVDERRLVLLGGYARKLFGYPLLLAALALGLAPAMALGADSSEQARAWLARMVQAARSLNYDGTFVYGQGEQMESMRIIHRADPDGERERLVALTGVAREVIRDSTRVTCILPDDQSVVVGKSRPPPIVTLPRAALHDAGEKYYALSHGGVDRVAGRATEVVRMEPRDRYRYGLRLSVDRDTGLLLKSELMGSDGRAVEQVVYTSIELPATIPDALLEPQISGKGFTWITSDDGGHSTSRQQAEVKSDWQVGWLPGGFVMSNRAQDRVPSVRMPVEHFVYTDGLASLSVYVERLDADSQRLDGLSNMGAVNAFGRTLAGHQVTVVGEVPAATVEAVAKGVSHRRGATR